MIQTVIRQPSYPTPRGKTGAGKRQPDEAAHIIQAPTRAGENLVPSDESLSDLIRSALASLKKGITWDRGSIINLNV